MAHNTLVLDLFLVGASAIIFSIYILTSVYLSNKKKILSKELTKAFGIVFFFIGLVALILTSELFFFEPIPHQYVEVYGTMLAIFSLVTLSGGISLYGDTNLKPVSYLAGLGGILSFQSANSILSFNLSKSPLLTSVIFVLAGISGLLTIILTHINNQKSKLWFSLIFSFILVVLGVICIYISINAIYGHIAVIITQK